MIRFKCPDCSAGLRVDDSKAGKLIACPSCGRKVRAPARSPAEPEIVEELPVVEEEALEEVEPADEEDRPRPPRKPRRKPPPPDEEEDLDEERRREVVTWNRIMGIAGVIFGLGFTAAALASRADFRNPLNTAYNFVGCSGLLFGVLLLVVGAIYAIRG